MKTFKASENDGTIGILHSIKQPMQGTFVDQVDGQLVVAKGILRPPFMTEDGRVEEEAHVADAAFGKSMATAGTFYKVQQVGRRRCGFSYQTALFSLQRPEVLIDKDTERFQSMTALDMLPKESRKKVDCGVPLSFLLNELTPWNLITAFDIEGVRATAYASELVPRGDHDSIFVEKSVSQAFAKVGVTTVPGAKNWDTSWFMLLPDSARLLCKQLGCKQDDLYDKEFLVHRDPALPDGTDLYPAQYAGVAKWVGQETGSGVVMHPQDPRWRGAGGDFDGDDATIYAKLPGMDYYGPILRPMYKTTGRKYVSDNVADQMIEAAADRTPGMLGSSILGMMRLVERGLGDDANRALGAAIAQAAVDSKKHPVDHERVASANRLLTRQVQEGRAVYPEYISDYINAIGNAKGAEDKFAVWASLCLLIDQGMWSEGSPVERAMIRRINELRRLFEEVNWYRELRDQQLPQNIKSAAIAAAKNNALNDAVQEITRQYVDTTIKVQLYAADDKDARPFKDELARARTEIRAACTTGHVKNLKVTPKEAQTAVIAYGPQRLASQFVPSETFVELSGSAKYLYIALAGQGWVSGEYLVADVQPIPACLKDWEQFMKHCGHTVVVQVLGESRHVTRVKISSLTAIAVS